MRFTVRWSRRTLDAVAEMWIGSAAEERAAITGATAAIDRVLQSNPGEQGESRDDEGHRILFMPPFVVTFGVADETRIVRVLNVRTLRRR